MHVLDSTFKLIWQVVSIAIGIIQFGWCLLILLLIRNRYSKLRNQANAQGIVAKANLQSINQPKADTLSIAAYQQLLSTAYINKSIHKTNSHHEDKQKNFSKSNSKAQRQLFSHSLNNGDDSMKVAIITSQNNVDDNYDNSSNSNSENSSINISTAATASKQQISINTSEMYDPSPAKPRSCLDEEGLARLEFIVPPTGLITRTATDEAAKLRKTAELKNSNLDYNALTQSLLEESKYNTDYHVQQHLFNDQAGSRAPRTTIDSNASASVYADIEDVEELGAITEGTLVAQAAQAVQQKMEERFQKAVRHYNQNNRKKRSQQHRNSIPELSASFGENLNCIVEDDSTQRLIEKHAVNPREIPSDVNSVDVSMDPSTKIDGDTQPQLAAALCQNGAEDGKDNSVDSATSQVPDAAASNSQSSRQSDNSEFPRLTFPAILSPSSPDFLVLPIYYNFLLLQSIHCFLWFCLILALVIVGDDLLDWNARNRTSEAWAFSILTSVLMGVHACLVDGVLFFLSRRSVGRRAIKQSLIFSGVWGLINCSVCIVLSSARGFESSIGDNGDREPRGQLPIWSPYFVRTGLMFCYSTCLLLLPDGILRYSRADRKQRKGYAQVGMYDIGVSCLLCGLYIIDYFIPSDADYLASALIVIFLLNFAVYTPILYVSLLKDSVYWRSTWKRALFNLRAFHSPSHSIDFSSPSSIAAPDSGNIQSVTSTKSNHSAVSWNNLISPLSAVSPASFANRLHAQHYYDLSVGRNILIDSSELIYGRLLGKGGFSAVYSAKLLGSLEVAVKQLHVAEITKETVDTFLKETGIICKLNHPHIVKYIGCVFSPPDFAIVMERCRRQSLMTLIAEHRVKFNERQAVRIGLAIADALRYIHSQGILHRDLKAANILFDASGVIKLCDFGLSEQNNQITAANLFCGTLSYMSSEVLRMESSGRHSDVYSWSIVFWELLHNRLAWRDHNNRPVPARTLIHWVANENKRPPIIERKGDSNHWGIHHDLAALLRECWQINYRNRPKFEEVCDRLTKFQQQQQLH
jgi:hypothetical protein